MGLQINTNVQALNAYRNLTGTQGAMSLSLERLSSGLRINRAADDAAGLAISEKLRSQVNGLNQAQANAQDGVSLIQTAEGALNEVHSILQRMRSLAVQSASDTNTDADRAAIQKEVSALVKEIDSTAVRTQFNGMNLLDGSFEAKSLQIGANQAQGMGVSIADLSTKGLNLTERTELTGLDTDGATGSVTLTAASGASLTEVKYVLGSNKQVLLNGDAVGTYTDAKITINGQNFSAASGQLMEGLAFDASSAGTVTTGTMTVKNAATFRGQVDAGSYALSGTDVKSAASGGAIVGKLSSDGKTVTFKDGTSINFTAALTGTASFDVVTVATTGQTYSVDLSSKQGATDAIKMIDGAIGRLSDQRADLGALQNRLTHTIANLGVSAENLAASESRIRDTDMAKEMTAFTRSQILQQAGVSMLAQANQSSQSVLKLLG